MAADRDESGIDVDAEQPVDRRPPPDQPGKEGLPSRSDSRKGALAATEKPASADLATSASDEDLEHGEAPRPYAERLDVPIDDGQPTPREVLKRFAPAEAHLPEITEEEAAEYVEQNADQRPWLAVLKDCDPSTRRVLVTMDLSQGHALERHEGYADDEKLLRRVTALEDPAQLDDDKRAAGIDGCKPGDQAHRCGDTATAIQDPNAFATAFARGVEHPDVQSALQTPFEPGVRPTKVSLAIGDLLGADGHRYCSGYKLEPVGGSIQAAQDRRSAWVEARSDSGGEVDVPPPRCSPVEYFEEATVEYFFRPTRTRDGYEIATMYIRP
jgi:hypothetical protein